MMGTNFYIWGLLSFSSSDMLAEISDPYTIAVRLCKEADAVYNGSNGAFMNREKAFQLYKQATEHSYLPAMKSVAQFYDKGVVVEKYWLNKSAEHEDEDAQDYLERHK